MEGKREGEKKSRAVLATFRRREMGQAVSISRTKNDFELVIRATKELEWILEAQFGAPNGKTVGLHDKISAARIPGSAQPLPEAVTRKMRKLVTIRNSLVHDREVNTIADRAMFVKDWQEVRHSQPSNLRPPWCEPRANLSVPAAESWHAAQQSCIPPHCTISALTMASSQLLGQTA